jgi:hypothetical protein
MALLCKFLAGIGGGHLDTPLRWFVSVVGIPVPHLVRSA